MFLNIFNSMVVNNYLFLRKHIYCVLLFVGLIGCINYADKDISAYKESRIKYSDDLLRLSVGNLQPKISIDSIISEMKVLPLETNEESLIGYIDDIQFDDSLIFIADYNKAKSIFIFSINGEFINKISSFGEGNEEYMSLAGFELDKLNKIIYLLDGTKGKILKWGYNGDFLTSINLPFKNINSFKYKNNDVFYFDFGYRNNDFNKKKSYNLIGYNIKNKKNELSFFLYDFNVFRLRVMEENHLIKIGDKIYYYTLLGKSVYEVNNDSLNTVCDIDFVGKQYPEESYMLTNKELSKNEKSMQYKKLGLYLAFKDWIYVLIKQKDRAEHLFYDKRNGNSYLNVSHMYINGAYIAPNIYFYDEKKFCGWIDPSLSYNFGVKNDSEEDNFSLIFYTLK